MTYGYNYSGWITTDLFQSWLSVQFLKHAVHERSLLLLLNGHSSHYQPEVIWYIKILVLCFPPHTTHEAQPLHCTVFSPLKAQWRTVCHDFFLANPGRVIAKFNFHVSLFVQAWWKAVVSANNISGFQTCGVYPLNVSAIHVAKARPESSSDRGCIRNADTNVDDNCVASTYESRNEFTSELEMLDRRKDKTCI